MKLTVLVKPNAKEDTVQKLSDTEFLIRVKAPARDGKANEAVVNILSEFLNIPKSNIKIISGFKGKRKIVEIK